MEHPIKKPFYITTTLPYVNAAPHIGFALEIVQADVVARFHRARGRDVFFNTGTDEHGIKIYENARAAGKAPQEYVDENTQPFQQLMGALTISEHTFIRTTDANHIVAAQAFWVRCAERGYIEKKLYRMKYCRGCELEKTDSELEDGRCSIHPNLTIEEREEENYFFTFSRFQKELLELYERYPDFVLPAHRLTEIKNFVAAGLRDFSISRLAEKMPWGIPVPNDPTHVMYVWFDALVNYIATVGWPTNAEQFELFWGTQQKPLAVQVAGKDNLRQQSAMWQAMLIAAGLPPSRQIFIHGFITSGGQKMSKSLGNVVDPFEAVRRFGVDTVRYYLLREIPASEDGDFSYEKCAERYTSDLANGIGNFTARVTALAEPLGIFDSSVSSAVHEKITQTADAIYESIETFRFHEALGSLWELIRFGDACVNERAPWALSNREEKCAAVRDLVGILEAVRDLVGPFLPTTAEQIASCLSVEGNGVRVIKKSGALFPRLS